MVQLTSSVAVAVLLAAPSLAAPLRAAPHVVHPGSHLEAREPRVKGIRIPKGADVSTGGAYPTVELPSGHPRDLEYLEELAAREPIFGKIFKVAKKVAGGAAQVAAGALSGRDLEFDAREPAKVISKISRGGKGPVVSNTAGISFGGHYVRDLDLLEELAEREPILGGLVFKAARKAVGVAAGALSSRELEECELSAREIDALDELAARTQPHFNHWRKGGAPAPAKPAGGVAGVVNKVKGLFTSKPASGGAAAAGKQRRELEVFDLSAREIDELQELAARDPAFRAIAKKIKGLFTSKRVGGAAEAVGIGAAVGGAATQEQPVQRDLTFIEDLIARDFEFNELD